MRLIECGRARPLMVGKSWMLEVTGTKMNSMCKLSAVFSLPLTSQLNSLKPIQITPTMVSWTRSLSTQCSAARLARVHWTVLITVWRTFAEKSSLLCLQSSCKKQSEMTKTKSTLFKSLCTRVDSTKKTPSAAFRVLAITQISATTENTLFTTKFSLWMPLNSTTEEVPGGCKVAEITAVWATRSTVLLDFLIRRKVSLTHLKQSLPMSTTGFPWLIGTCHTKTTSQVVTMWSPSSGPPTLMRQRRASNKASELALMCETVLGAATTTWV